MKRARQAAFEFRSWGGARAGAGRKTTRARPAAPHRVREDFRPYQPVHVSLRMAAWVWNLRSRRSYAIIHAAVRELRERRDLRVVDYSVQGNHLHLIVEAEGPPALAAGMRALSIRLARRLNAMMGRRGPVLEDRYHAHVLRTPAEVRNALRYVLGNFRSHAAHRGEKVPAQWVDPYSSAAVPEGLHAQGELWREPVTQPAETWLLRTAAGKGGGRRRAR